MANLNPQFFTRAVQVKHQFATAQGGVAKAWSGNMPTATVKPLSLCLNMLQDIV